MYCRSNASVIRADSDGFSWEKGLANYHNAKFIKIFSGERNSLHGTQHVTLNKYAGVIPRELLSTYFCLKARSTLVPKDLTT